MEQHNAPKRFAPRVYAYGERQRELDEQNSKTAPVLEPIPESEETEDS